jgi:glutathione S-transferase
MALRLYDLAGADPNLRFSPYCWRTRLALAHKGLAVETIPWRFTDKDVIAFSRQGRVPVLVDGDDEVASDRVVSDRVVNDKVVNDKVVNDSWAIAEYLETTYPDRPSLFGGAAAQAVARFVNSWADTIQLPGILRLVVSDIIGHVHEKDKAYFRTSREQRFGMTLEAFSADRERHVVVFRQSLQPLRTVLAAQPFVGGNPASYADYIIFGGFQWARCVTAFELLEPDDPVAAWRDRLLGAFDGLARRAVRAV